MTFEVFQPSSVCHDMKDRGHAYLPGHTQEEYCWLLNRKDGEQEEVNGNEEAHRVGHLQELQCHVKCGHWDEIDWQDTHQEAGKADGQEDCHVQVQARMQLQGNEQSHHQPVEENQNTMQLLTLGRNNHRWCLWKTGSSRLNSSLTNRLQRR